MCSCNLFYGENLKMACSICIATYKRPELLKKLLESLLTQNLPDDVNVEVIVVDNDVNETAKNICNEFMNNNTLNIHYSVQPEKNISLTRNQAVKNSTGEYILFIDDDGYADDNWILELLKCLKTFNADAVFGTVIPYFEEGIPDWIEESHFFKRTIQTSGETSKFTRTGNCLIKSNLIKSVEGPFDPDYGLTGGEDGILFGRLAIKGAKFVFCSEAIVHDYVPKERANLKYLTKRTFRIGITHTKRMIISSKFKLITRFYLFIKGVLYSLISILLFLFCSPIKLWRSHWYLKIISNLGRIAGVFNLQYQIYKV